MKSPSSVARAFLSAFAPQVGSRHVAADILVDHPRLTHQDLLAAQAFPAILSLTKK